MKPYYERDGITIYNGDCRDVLVGITPPESTLIVTDPPYGIGENNQKNLSRGKPLNQKVSRVKSSVAKAIDYGEFTWDKKIDKELFALVVSKSKDQIIFGGNYYADWVPPSSCWIVWDKDNSGDFADCELAYTSFKTAVRKFKYRWNGMLQEDMKHKETRYHPTQKPLALMRWVLEKYAKDYQLILDPFMGSGTTLVAAKQLGIKAVGIELEQKYCDIAIERLAQGVMVF